MCQPEGRAHYAYCICWRAAEVNFSSSSMAPWGMLYHICKCTLQRLHGDWPPKLPVTVMATGGKNNRHQTTGKLKLRRAVPSPPPNGIYSIGACGGVDCPAGDRGGRGETLFHLLRCQAGLPWSGRLRPGVTAAATSVDLGGRPPWSERWVRPAERPKGAGQSDIGEHGNIFQMRSVSGCE